MQLNYFNRPYFENGAIKKISDILKNQEIKNPLICTDPGLSSIGMTDQIRNLISDEFSSTFYEETPANPTEKAVMDALELYKANCCDGVIGFGGGSSIDLAKAVALMANHDGNLLNYSVNEGGYEKITETMPMIAIPTTSGTGSEVSVGSLITMNDGRKLIFASPHLIPNAAICDPELTIGLPPVLTAGSGMDALTHCIEAILSPINDPPAEAVGIDGIEKIIKEESLIKACKDGQDKEARWNMMMASTEGAMAFSKGLGAVHSMSHALGANQELRLHHGTLNAVILPSVLRFNKDHVGNKYSRIARAMGKNESTDLANEIEKLNGDIGVPSNLGEMGVTEDMIPKLVAHAITDPSNLTTPRLPSQEEWEKLFLECI
ncbi:MAG: 4-hydroxybutyrate dehydrogenase [Gammaproteobacteria bacterium]|nr:4-hydroxybutyrate dehydrogenase [Gammaproteobacteria bacterium]|tara:strand:- start:443 stop:1573 length:1131 start_codon:yes stop_codon:yes gene_type:complete